MEQNPYIILYESSKKSFSSTAFSRKHCGYLAIQLGLISNALNHAMRDFIYITNIEDLDIIQKLPTIVQFYDQDNQTFVSPLKNFKFDKVEVEQFQKFCQKLGTYGQMLKQNERKRVMEVEEIKDTRPMTPEKQTSKAPQSSSESNKKCPGYCPQSDQYQNINGNSGRKTPRIIRYDIICSLCLKITELGFDGICLNCKKSREQKKS